MNGSEADNYELRLNYSKEVLAKSVCQTGAKEEYQDTRLNRQQLGTKSLKRPKNRCRAHETFCWQNMGVKGSMTNNWQTTSHIPGAIGPNTVGHSSPPDPKGRKKYFFLDKKNKKVKIGGLLLNEPRPFVKCNIDR